MANTLGNGIRAERKLLITVAEWTGASHDVYTLTTSQPANWATNYTDYYTKSGNTYVQVTGANAPTWTANTYYSKTTTTRYREILGTRTEDSSVEFNADIQTSTDIRGISYADVNKTEPQQDLDPFYVMGGSDLAIYLSKNALKNNITAYSNFADIYLITAYDDVSETSTPAYYTVKHQACSIIPTAIGGDAYVNMPIEIHLSNDIVEGSVDTLTEGFTFTAAS